MNTKIKKWFFKTCPKSGRIVGINKKNVVLKICFPLFGLAALIWFLIRVVPKPSRIDYPCQQIAAPIAFSFVAFISSTLVGFGTWKRFKLLWHSRRFYMGLSILAVGILLSGSPYGTCGAWLRLWSYRFKRFPFCSAVKTEGFCYCCATWICNPGVSDRRCPLLAAS